jgi:hypothetical protein
MEVFRIRMFFDLPDPHPDPYQNVTDPQHWSVGLSCTYIMYEGSEIFFGGEGVYIIKAIYLYVIKFAVNYMLWDR